jgi:hypothetical protein
MIPMPAGFHGSGRDEYIAFIEKQVEYGRNLATAIAEVAAVLMGGRRGWTEAGHEYKSEAAARLEHALVDWFCAGPEDQIRQIKAQPPLPIFVGSPSWPMAASVEQLTNLIKRRDELQDQLDQYDDVTEKASKAPGGEVMSQYMRVVVMPVKQELARLETQISEVQAALESAGPEE